MTSCDWLKKSWDVVIYKSIDCVENRPEETFTHVVVKLRSPGEYFYHVFAYIML